METIKNMENKAFGDTELGMSIGIALVILALLSPLIAVIIFG